jgi:hypothetical protein
MPTQAQYRTNPEKYKTAARSYYKTHGRSEYQRQFQAQRYKNDPVYRAKHKRYMADRTERRKKEIRAWIFQLKSSTPCADCKNKYPPVCMDFDHLPGTDKLNDVAQMTGGWNSLEKVKQEVAKCELVCANCHRLRTQNRRK